MSIQEFKASMLIALAPSFTNCVFDEATGNATTHAAHTALFQTVERLAEMASAAGILQEPVGRLDEATEPEKEQGAESTTPALVCPPSDVRAFLGGNRKYKENKYKGGE